MAIALVHAALVAQIKPYIYMPRSTRAMEQPNIAPGGACAASGGRDPKRSFWLIPTERVLAMASKPLVLAPPAEKLPPPLDALPPHTIEGSHHGRLEELLVRRLALTARAPTGRRTRRCASSPRRRRAAATTGRRCARAGGWL